MGFFKSLIDTIISATASTFSFKDNTLIFKVSSDEFYTYELGNYDLKTRHDPYVLEAYTLKNKDISLEYIKVDEDTSWNGSAISFYETFFQNELKIKSLVKIEDVEISNYVFRIYKIDDSFCFFYIYIYEVNKDIFIIDTKGELYNNLIKKFKNDYSNKLEDIEKGDINFDISLVKRNSIEDFFSYEKD